MTLDILLSFFEPIADRFSDPDVNEIRINPNGTLFEEWRGQTRAIDAKLSPTLIEFAAGALSGEADLPLNHRHPKLDVRLEDGSRVAILGPAVCGQGYAITVRRFPTAFTLSDLVSQRTLTGAQADLLETAVVRERKTVVISGGTRAGKTTLARVLLNRIPHPGDRMVLIEQPSELNLADRDIRDIVAIEVREETPNAPAFSARDAVRAALRHSPDRIILGELRGEEAADFLEALNTGHSGSLTTLHANSATDALDRLATLCLHGARPQARDIVIDTIARAINLVVHMDRIEGRRIISEIVKVGGVKGGRILTEAV